MAFIRIRSGEKNLTMWTTGGRNFQFKLTNNDLIRINQRFYNASKSLPFKIHRKVRPIHSIKHWKATEFRTTLLYVGMVAFKSILRDEEYCHFIKLVCAVHICSVDKYRSFLRIAKMPFGDYIEGYIELYGIDSIGSNVHNLCHIVEDVERLGNNQHIQSKIVSG